MDALFDSHLNAGQITARLRLGANMEAFLREYRSREIWYFPVPGNTGDSLLQVGIYQAFRRAGIAFRIIDDKTDLGGKIVFVGGGGNLTKYYKEVREFLLQRSAIAKARQLIILPHSIGDNDDLLADMDNRVTIFCRETKSYEYVTRTAATRNVYIDHDMAIHIDTTLFDSECDKYPDVTGLYDYTLRQHGLAEDFFDGGVKLCLRADGESSRGTPPPGNVDLSTLFSFGTWPENSYKAAWCLLRAVSRASRIVTDRLHVAVACSLVDTPCDLIDNAYGKCSGIFYHTMRKYSGSVSMVENADTINELAGHAQTGA